MKRALRHRYGRARRVVGWASGDVARTTAKIFADPPIHPPALVTIEEIKKMGRMRRKDTFGSWETSGGGTRIRVGHGGKSYWVNAENLEKP